MSLLTILTKGETILFEEQVPQVLVSSDDVTTHALIDGQHHNTDSQLPWLSRCTSAQLHCPR